ncbi:hypothetical protein ONZ45_g12083 [Pleurotus djamor]|nr:hypothetical protein ONZ45_g12083 [Pleurotus djamor]
MSSSSLAESSKLMAISSSLVTTISGIGGYPRPSFRSWGYWKQVIYNHVDTAIAWNFEKIVHAEPHDRSFVVGFSRGAYQVRVIAGMIEKVGLLHKGNENRIALRPIQSDFNTHGPETRLSTNFSGTFSDLEAVSLILSIIINAFRFAVPHFAGNVDTEAG